MSQSTVLPATTNELLQRVAQQQQDIIERLDRLEKAHCREVVKEAYTTDEAAKRLGRSEWTVRQWCNKNQVAGAYKIRGKGRTGEWRLPHAAVIQLQAEGPLRIGTGTLELVA